jgi:uncharacterized protein (TIGR02246 family)
MNRMSFDRLGPIVFATLLSLSAPFAYAGDTRVEIEAVVAEMQAIANRGDSKAIADLYTADAQFLPEGSDPIKGRAAIAKYFQGGFDAGFGNIRFKTLEVYSHGSTATEVGEYDWGNKEGVSVDHGKYIVVYLKVGGRWMLHRDMSTSSVPPTKPSS